MLPAINNKLYQSIVSAMISLPNQSPERRRLEVLQKQLSEAQQEMYRDKSISVWLKAG